MASPKNKMAIIGTSVFLLVAVVAAVAVTMSSRSSADPTAAGSSAEGLSTSTKAVKSVCAPTDYKETCESTLTKVAGNTTDPRELIKLAFNVTIAHVTEAFGQSAVLKDAEKDPSVKDALDSCHELLEYSIDDLRASLEHLAGIQMSQVDNVVNDLQSWLAASYTYQDTCLDDFGTVDSPASQGMQKALNGSMQLTSNINVMVEQVRKLFKGFNLDALTGAPGETRKLMAAEGEKFPSWVSGAKRMLLDVPLTQLEPTVIVAADGSGQFKSVQEALNTVPKKNKVPFVIRVKAGIYKEQVIVEKEMSNVVLVGDGPTKTVITFDASNTKGVKTWKTATVGVQGANFMARDIGIENSAGPEGHQAVALRVNAEYAVIYNCQIDGYQDTLYVQNYRQYYRDCTISGTVDFIFGDAIAVIQNSNIVVRKPLANQQNMVTAQGRKDRNLATALVLQNCTIRPDPALVPVIAKIPSYLGRPWKEYARVLFIENYIDGFISPDGYTPWIDGATMKPVNIDTSFYAEINNRGPGADMSRRVKWPGVKQITAADAQKFTVGTFIQGNEWLPATGVPFIPGLLSN